MKPSEHYAMRFNVRHRGCSSDGFNRLFPKAQLECFNMQFIRGEAIDLFRINGPEETLPKIMGYFRDHPTIKKVDVLEQKGTQLYLRMVSRKVGRVRTLSEIIFQNHCHYLKPLRYENDREVWTLGTDAKENFTRVLREIRKVGDVEIRSIRKSSFGDFLTPQERRAVITARLMGYYQWPRRVGVRALAAQLGIGKTALLHALRKAEAKIIENSI